jgi:hypothetical protein
MFFFCSLQAGTWEEKNLNSWASSRIKVNILVTSCWQKYLAYDTPSTVMILFVKKKSLTFAGYFVLQDLLGSLGSLEFPTGKASVDEVSKCSGDVSIS